MTRGPSAAKLGPGEADTTVPSTALGMLPFKISQDMGQSPQEQIKKKIPHVAQQPNGEELQGGPSGQK